MHNARACVVYAMRCAQVALAGAKRAVRRRIIKEIHVVNYIKNRDHCTDAATHYGLTPSAHPALPAASATAPAPGCMSYPQLHPTGPRPQPQPRLHLAQPQTPTPKSFTPGLLPSLKTRRGIKTEVCAGVAEDVAAAAAATLFERFKDAGGRSGEGAAASIRREIALRLVAGGLRCIMRSMMLDAGDA
jgi:hypothetical protein